MQLKDHKTSKRGVSSTELDFIVLEEFTVTVFAVIPSNSLKTSVEYLFNYLFMHWIFLYVY